ncbi:DinI-like family protein [Rahnella inusitata]
MSHGLRSQCEVVVMRGITHDKEVIDVMLQGSWGDADDWFQP